MKQKLNEWSRRYLAALQKHLREASRASLQPARGLGHQAIASGLYNNAKNKLARSPEMRNLSNATMIFVFGL